MIDHVFVPPRYHCRGAYRDQSAFEVRDRAEDMEHELADRRGGVEALLKASQMDPTGLEVGHGLKQLA